MPRPLLEQAQDQELQLALAVEALAAWLAMLPSGLSSCHVRSSFHQSIAARQSARRGKVRYIVECRDAGPQHRVALRYLPGEIKARSSEDHNARTYGLQRS